MEIFTGIGMYDIVIIHEIIIRFRLFKIPYHVIVSRIGCLDICSARLNIIIGIVLALYLIEICIGVVGYAKTLWVKSPSVIAQGDDIPAGCFILKAATNLNTVFSGITTLLVQTGRV